MSRREGERAEAEKSVLKASGKLRRIFQRVAPSEHFKQLHAADMKNCEEVNSPQELRKIKINSIYLTPAGSTHTETHTHTDTHTLTLWHTVAHSPSQSHTHTHTNNPIYVLIAATHIRSTSCLLPPSVPPLWRVLLCCSTHCPRPNPAAHCLLRRLLSLPHKYKHKIA